eukprot:1687440-Pyramimonas_sp.AAC.1
MCRWEGPSPRCRSQQLEQGLRKELTPGNGLRIPGDAQASAEPEWLHRSKAKTFERTGCTPTPASPVTTRSRDSEEGAMPRGNW